MTLSEVFKYNWTLSIMDYATKQEKVIIDDLNELRRIYNKFKDNVIWVGYNSRNYDTTIFKALLLNMNPYEVSDKLINQGMKPHQISKEFNKIELYNYDCIVLNTSLKQLEGFFGESIVETSIPFDIDRTLTEKELIDKVIPYNLHDVRQTAKVLEANWADFEAHVGIIKEFKLPMKSFNKTKAQLTAEVLGAERLHNLKDAMDYEFLDCIKLDKYKYVMEWFDNNRSYKTINEKGKEVKTGLKTKVMGVDTDFGWGGLHAAKKKYISEGLLVHSDVASYYPSIMRYHKLLSRAVKEPDKFKTIMDKRLEYKKAKNPIQASLKVMINGAYGVCKDKYSPMFDEKRANEICINCQLLLLDLCEKLEMEFGENIVAVNLNTDGIIMELKNPNDLPRYKEICKEWEDRTNFKLEHDLISKIIQKDVNNYIFKFKDGKLERKGAYVKDLKKTDYNLEIVNRAVVEYLLNGTPVEDTVNNCKRLIDFQYVCKIGSTYKNIRWGDKDLDEKVIRTFAANKDLPGVVKIKYVEKDGVVTERVEKIANTPERCMIINENIVNKKVPDWLDKSYYIDMAKKRIKDYLGDKKVNC